MQWWRAKTACENIQCHVQRCAKGCVYTTLYTFFYLSPALCASSNCLIYWPWPYFFSSVFSFTQALQVSSGCSPHGSMQSVWNATKSFHRKTSSYLFISSWFDHVGWKCSTNVFLYICEWIFYCNLNTNLKINKSCNNKKYRTIVNIEEAMVVASDVSLKDHRLIFTLHALMPYTFLL